VTTLGLRLSALPTHEPAMAWLSTVAATAESAGFDSLWVADDPAAGELDVDRLAGDAGSLEAYTTLGALARCSQRVRLGAMASPAALRSPALLAKLVTAVDLLSGGRAAVVLRGTPDAVADAATICRQLFAGREVHYRGSVVHVTGAVNRPPPRSDGGPPIMVATDGEEATMAVAARLADGVVLTGAAAAAPAPALATLAARCRAAGRDEAALTAVVLFGADTPGPVAEMAATARAAGADGIVLDVAPPTMEADPAGAHGALGALAAAATGPWRR
jgi:alkanesulfonate monooxygenase SsuD/methylene tetrahydromethanopterin reductase-like flavin-dependent oxidoreductase (luciferase family)